MLNVVRKGTGKPLLLIHGLGGSWQSWNTILYALAETRGVIAIDLPGHGSSPATDTSSTFDGLADAVGSFIEDQGLEEVDIVGSSLGARIALELARRGKVGSTVALDPGGFWQGWERTYFRHTLEASVRLVRGLRPLLPTLAKSAITRSLLLAQLSARPWALRPDIVSTELESIAATRTFDALVRDLAGGSMQAGPARRQDRPLTIGWGRQDRLCLPRQADRAQAAFPTARVYWFERCGHFPMWDQPEETVRLILENTV